MLILFRRQRKCIPCWYSSITKSELSNISSSSFYWATTIIKPIFRRHGACRVCLCCHRLIHRTLTWTKRSLTCAQILMHAFAHGEGYGHQKKSLYWKLTRGRKSLAAPGNRTCVSGVTVRCSNQLSYIPSPTHLFHCVQRTRATISNRSLLSSLLITAVLPASLTSCRSSEKPGVWSSFPSAQPLIFKLHDSKAYSAQNRIAGEVTPIFFFF